MVIVGSAALVKHLGPIRVPRDIDMFGTESEAIRFVRQGLNQGVKAIDRPNADKSVIHGERGAILELERTDTNGLNKSLHDLMIVDSRVYSDGMHAPLEWLYFLKMSHRFKKDSIHFMKTMLDIKLMKPLISSDLTKGYAILFTEREKVTYLNKLPNLNQKSETFFREEDSFYEYDHDTIHEAVKVGSSPAYTQYLKDGSEVMCSEEKWNGCSRETKLLGVLEETYVLTLERALIPHNFKPNPKKMFDKSLEKVCTNVTGGWFREFAYNNYFQVQRLYNPDFVLKFKNALDQGEIKKFERK